MQYEIVGSGVLYDGNDLEELMKPVSDLPPGQSLSVHILTGEYREAWNAFYLHSPTGGWLKIHIGRQRKQPDHHRHTDISLAAVWGKH